MHTHFSLVNPEYIFLTVSKESLNENFKSYSHESLLNSKLHIKSALTIFFSVMQYKIDIYVNFFTCRITMAYFVFVLYKKHP